MTYETGEPLLPNMVTTFFNLTTYVELVDRQFLPSFFPFKLVFIFNKLCMLMVSESNDSSHTKQQPPPPFPVPQRQLLGLLTDSQ